MRKSVLLLILLALPTTVFAQSDDDEDWRRRTSYNAPRENAFELTPFVGYRWGWKGLVENDVVPLGRPQVMGISKQGVNLRLAMSPAQLELLLKTTRASAELIFLMTIEQRRAAG